MSTRAAYSYRDYDEYLNVRPGLLFWLVMAFTLRPFVVLVASLSNRTDRSAILNIFYPDQFEAFLGCAAALPALLLLFGYVRRRPEAHAIFRAVWRKGKLLLTAALLLDIAVVVAPILTRGDIPATNGLVSGATSVVLLVLVVRSNRLKDAFAGFPDTVPSADSRRATA